MFYRFRAYQLYFNYLQQSMTRGQKVSKAAHSFKFRTLLNFSIIQPLKSSVILQCTHVFQRLHNWEVFGKVLVSIVLMQKVWCNLKVDLHSHTFILMALSSCSISSSERCRLVLFDNMYFGKSCWYDFFCQQLWVIWDYCFVSSMLQ